MIAFIISFCHFRKDDIDAIIMKRERSNLNSFYRLPFRESGLAIDTVFPVLSKKRVKVVNFMFSLLI